MTAIGRATVPDRAPQHDLAASAMPQERPPQCDPWIARGRLWRPSCRRTLVPVLHSGGLRAYSCGSMCPHDDVAAVPVEQDLLLKALVRAAFAVKHPALVSADEARRWSLANPLDSHAMLVAGFARVNVNDLGAWEPVWRHESGGGQSLTAKVQALAKAEAARFEAMA